MIRFPCDKCERLLAVPDEDAGQKVECPACGDVNVVPLRAGGGVAGGRGGGAAVEEGAAPAAPGDEGPERRLLFVRPSTWRAHPIVSALLLAGPFAVSAAVWLFAPASWAGAAPWWVWWLALPAAGWAAFGVLWVFVSGKVALEVTTRRCVRVDGLFLRDRREVFHRDVQSVTIMARGIVARALNVGNLQIESDESDKVEIEIRGLARPGKVKAAIDPYIGRWRRR